MFASVFFVGHSQSCILWYVYSATSCAVEVQQTLIVTQIYFMLL